MSIGFTNIVSGGGVKNLTASPEDVKMGLTFSRDGKTAETGTMNLTNLLPENIRQGVNIAGVVGELGGTNYASGVFTSEDHGKTFVSNDPRYTALSEVVYKNGSYYWNLTVRGLSFKPVCVNLYWKRYIDDPVLFLTIAAINNSANIVYGLGGQENSLQFIPYDDGFMVQPYKSNHYSTAILHTKQLSWVAK